MTFILQLPSSNVTLTMDSPSPARSSGLSLLSKIKLFFSLRRAHQIATLQNCRIGMSRTGLIY
jgi:hypothetical protein